LIVDFSTKILDKDFNQNNSMIFQSKKPFSIKKAIFKQNHLIFQAKRFFIVDRLDFSIKNVNFSLNK